MFLRVKEPPPQKKGPLNRPYVFFGLKNNLRKTQHTYKKARRAEAPSLHTEDEEIGGERCWFLLVLVCAE